MDTAFHLVWAPRRPAKFPIGDNAVPGVLGGGAMGGLGEGGAEGLGGEALDTEGGDAGEGRGGTGDVDAREDAVGEETVDGIVGLGGVREGEAGLLPIGGD